MNVLIVDSGGYSLDFAIRCKEAGHSIKMFQRKHKDGSRSKVGDGFVEKVLDWKAWMRWADLVFLPDNAIYMHDMEPFRKYGYPIFGCNVEGAKLELERMYGQDKMAEAGIKTIPSEIFTSYDKAEAFIRKNMKRYVSKPSGDADKALSYVSKSPADMIYMIRRWKKNATLKSPFLLQEFIPGIEMAVGGWFGPSGFSEHVFENFEFKKLMPGDKGPTTGEMFTVGKYTKKSKLADKVLYPMEEHLHSIGYSGYIDVAVMIDEEGTPWPLEFTARPGWPCFNLQSATHPEPCEWMANLLDGYDTLKPDTNVAACAVVAIPDFPYSKLTKKDVTGVPVYGIESWEHIHACEMMMGVAPTVIGNKVMDLPCPVTAGDYVLVTSGQGDTVSQACKAAYKVIDGLEIPNSPIVRIDGGVRLKKQLPELHYFGYAKDVNY